MRTHGTLEALHRPQPLHEGLTMTLDQNLIERLTLDDKRALHELGHLLGLAQQSWNRIDRCKQSELTAMHHAEGSLAFCLARAIQAVEELTAAVAAGLPDGR